MTPEELLKKRTLRQNRALHKFFTLLAEEFNDNGLDMRKVLKPEVDIPWTAESVKNHMWRPLQDAMYDKKSTTELTTLELTRVYEVLNRFTAKNGIHVPFPSEEDFITKNY